MYWSTSSGAIELNISKHVAATAAHQGQCDRDILEVSNIPYIKRQLVKLAPALVASELKEWGTWNDIELTDHSQNIQRLLWLACCDINERVYWSSGKGLINC